VLSWLSSASADINCWSIDRLPAFHAEEAAQVDSYLRIDPHNLDELMVGQ
jgi:hypothetical protein